MKRPPQFLRVFAALCLALTGLAGAVGTPAGTEITNRAQAEYVLSTEPQPLVVESNEVRTTVQAVCALSVTPDGTLASPARRVSLLPGESVAFPYTLVNAGNARHDFAVAPRVDGGSVVPASRVLLDQNGNGQIDPGEPEVSSVTLDADASAALLLLVQTGSAQGEGFVNLLAGCAGGPRDENNVSAVVVGPPPALSIEKTFAPALVRPGTETTVTVVLRNGGAGESREVVLTDLLAAQADQGLVFVAGSAQGSDGVLEYTQDGAVWTTQEPNPVRGLRVRVPSLAPAASLTLSFRMLAQASAENRLISNTATAQTGSGASALTASGSATADVRYLPAVAIGPVGVPEAPEGSADDQQTRPLGVVGQPVCLDHTVKNTGDVRDLFTVSVTYPQGAAAPTLLAENGQPLAQPFALEPGQTILVRVCHLPTQAGALEALLTVTGERGTSNTTRDLVTQVEGGLPVLEKSVVATSVAADGSTLTLPAGATVAQGDTVTYTLRVRNPYAQPLTSLRVTDALPAALDFVSAPDSGVVGGTPGMQTVTWTLASLAGGATRDLVVVTRVSTRARDGDTLLNTFSLSSAELPLPLSSNEVRTPVWTGRLSVTKTVSAAQATYGDRLDYTLRITNGSPTTDIVDALVADTPAQGLSYLPGTSTLNGAPLADPTVQAGVLRWTLPRVAAGQTVVLTYALRVTPEATGDLINEVQVVGNGAGGVARAIASNRATAVTSLSPLGFAPLGEIVGTVYVDRDRNGRYDPRLDTPVPRARVLLAGGRQALTDAQGRYNFLNVPLGTHALRLDPGTTPYAPLAVPQDGGLSGTQTVHARGLTSVDFPLAPLGGDVDTLRRTTLILDDVRVEKTVYLVDGAYVVTLRVRTPRELPGAVLDDPLPAGAVLKDGRKSFAGTLPAGETVLTYRFDFMGEPRAATTDPTLSWRQ